MTKKRFTETLSTGIVTDNITGKEYLCEMRIDDDLLKLLNDLNDENTELKKQLTSIKIDEHVLKQELGNDCMTEKNNFKTTVERDVVKNDNQMFLDKLKGIPYDESLKRNMHYKSPTFSIKMEDESIPVMYFLTFEDMQTVCMLLETNHMRFSSCGGKK